jgi:hypothetical protein
MKVANTFALGFMLILVSSCGLQRDGDFSEMKRYMNQVYIDSILKFNKDSENLAKDVADYKARNNIWLQKWNSLLRSLSNEELQAHSEYVEACKNNNEAKIILAKRNFLSLFENSNEPDKIIAFRRLVLEAVEISKKENELDVRLHDLAKTKKSLLDWEQSRKEERKHEETVSAIKGIGSSIDSMRFDLEQSRMQKWLYGR